MYMRIDMCVRVHCAHCVCVWAVVCLFVCMCVYHLKRCKTSTFLYIILQGATRVPGGRWPTKTPPGYPCKRTCLHIYIYISSRPWAHLSRSWGGHILYRCCFILSMPPVILNIHTYFYSFFHVNNDVLHVGCFFTTQFAMTFPSKCVTHVGIRQGGMIPTREYLSR